MSLSSVALPFAVVQVTVAWDQQPVRELISYLLDL
jgi:hypothetical protein